MAKLVFFHQGENKLILQDEGVTFGLVINQSAKIKVILKNSQAHFFGYGLYFLPPQKSRAVTIFQHHYHPGGQGQFEVRSVLLAASRFNFRGKIKIDAKAKGTVANIINKNFLLADKLYLDSKPALVIANKDVSCRHGVVIERPDREQLFFLQQRGFKRQEAKQFLALAFLLRPLAQIQSWLNKEQKEKVAKALEEIHQLTREKIWLGAERGI